MTRTTRTPARPGFTLIELLVVLAIIAVLLALSGAGLQKTRINGMFARTNESVYKLHRSLGAEIERINEKARKAELPAQVLAFCDGNDRRARSLYLAMEQRRYFPQTFTEALTPTYIVTDASGVARIRVSGLVAGDNIQYTHPTQAQSTFAKVAGLTATNATDESGVLLLIIILEQSTAGGGAMASAGDDLTNALRVQVQLRTANGGPAELPAFKDGFDRAIGFRRWDYGTEAQSSDYTDAKATFKDPLDPEGLVGTWNSAKRTEMQALDFRGVNRLFTTYSLGKDLADPKDDVIGFRTNRAGKKGY